jgi:hypothetical protein
MDSNTLPRGLAKVKGAALVEVGVFVMACPEENLSVVERIMVAE